MTENKNNPDPVDAIDPEINVKGDTAHHRLRRRSDYFARQRRKDTKVIKAHKAERSRREAEAENEKLRREKKEANA